jgi:glycosyltransferase involved in cell wall biosynthesis
MARLPKTMKACLKHGSHLLKMMLSFLKSFVAAYADALREQEPSRWIRFQATPEWTKTDKTGNLKSVRRQLSVLMVSTYPPDTDGIASYTARLENALRKENITVRIAANGRDWKRNSLSYIYFIIRKARSLKTNVVHVQLSYFMFGNEYYTGLFPLLLVGLKFLGKKNVITLHDIVPKSNLTKDFLKKYTSPRFLIFKKWALIIYTKVVCSIVDKVIVHSGIAQNILIRDYGVPQKKLQIIPHGIDQYPMKSDEKINFNSPVVSYFGLVRKGKGLEDLVKAWQIVLKEVNAQLLIIGGKHPHIKDDCYENLVEIVRELGLEESIRFCGYVPNEILPAYFTASDAFVFPYNEWGDVITSSGALSVVAPYLKPMVVTDVPAFADLKKLGAAVVVKKGDIDGLASAIVKVLTDARTRGLLVDKLSKWLSESSWSNVAKKTALLYATLTLRKGSK